MLLLYRVYRNEEEIQAEVGEHVCVEDPSWDADPPIQIDLTNIREENVVSCISTGFFHLVEARPPEPRIKAMETYPNKIYHESLL